MIASSRYTHSARAGVAMHKADRTKPEIAGLNIRDQVVGIDMARRYRNAGTLE
jgi:hypothetical protein